MLLRLHGEGVFTSKDFNQRKDEIEKDEITEKDAVLH